VGENDEVFDGEDGENRRQLNGIIPEVGTGLRDLRADEDGFIDREGRRARGGNFLVGIVGGSKRTLRDRDEGNVEKIVVRREDGGSECKHDKIAGPAQKLEIMACPEH